MAKIRIRSQYLFLRRSWESSICFEYLKEEEDMRSLKLIIKISTNYKYGPKLSNM